MLKLLCECWPAVAVLQASLASRKLRRKAVRDLAHPTVREICTPCAQAKKRRKSVQACTCLHAKCAGIAVQAVHADQACVLSGCAEIEGNLAK